jgi:hypothetical protein
MVEKSIKTKSDKLPIEAAVFLFDTSKHFLLFAEGNFLKLYDVENKTITRTKCMFGASLKIKGLEKLNGNMVAVISERHFRLVDGLTLEFVH